VLFVFPSVHTARLEVGYGLEGVIPDIEARRLLEATLLPKFSAGRYEEGFEDFLDILVKRLQEHADEAVKRDKLIGIVDFAMGILRQVCRGACCMASAVPESLRGGRDVHLPLVPECNDEQLIAYGLVVIMREKTRHAAVDHELAPVALDRAADEGMLLQHAQGVEDDPHGFGGGLRLLIPEEFDEPLEIRYGGWQQLDHRHGATPSCLA